MRSEVVGRADHADAERAKTAARPDVHCFLERVRAGKRFAEGLEVIHHVHQAKAQFLVGLLTRFRDVEWRHDPPVRPVYSLAVLGRLGFVLSPLLVAELVPILGWGRTLSLTAGFPVLCLGLIWLWLQETARKELEESPRLPE